MAQAHLTEDQLRAFASGQLSSGALASADAHLDACDACRQHLVDALGRTSPGAPPLAGALTRGSLLGRYVVLDALGAGGFGTVYEAFDPELERKVALKLLHDDAEPGTAEHRERHERLRREARALARLAHPNVVPVYDFGEFGGRVYLALELVRGTSLRPWLATRPPHREVLRVFMMAGRGLAAAHAEGVVHRDVKPENILLGEDGRARVSDFGLALPGSGGGASAPSNAPSVTQGSVTRGLFGTPAYMSPEQLDQRPADARSDQFSFCVALFEALFQERPWPGSTLAERLQSRSAPVTMPSGVSPSLRVRRALRRGLSLDPADRFPSMDALLDELRERRPWPWVAALAGVALVGVGALTLREPRPLCTGAEQLISQSWGAPQRQAVRAGLARPGEPWSEAAADAAVKSLDAWASAWSGMHTAACEATRVRGEQSEAMLDKRMVCLERLRAELDGVVARVSSAGDPAQALEQVSLPPPSRCGRLDELASLAPLPTEPEARARVQAAGNLVSRFAGLVRADLVNEARALVPQVTAEGLTSGYAPLEAEAALWLGAQSGDAAWLDRALSVALSSGADAVAADTAMRRARWALSQSQEAAQGWLALARGLVERHRDSKELSSALLMTEARVLRARGAYRKSARQFLAAAEQAPNEATRAEARWEAALTLTLAAQLCFVCEEGEAADGGSCNTCTAATLEGLPVAPQTVAARDLYLELKDSAVAQLGAQHPLVARADEGLAHLYLTLGQYSRAREHARQALVVREATTPERSVQRLSAMMLLSLLDALEGDALSALPRARAAMEGMAQHPNSSATEVATFRGLFGEVLLAAGLRAEARRAFEASIKELEAGKAPPGALRQPKCGLGEVLAHEEDELEEASVMLRECSQVVDSYFMPRSDLGIALVGQRSGWKREVVDSYVQRAKSQLLFAAPSRARDALMERAAAFKR